MHYDLPLKERRLRNLGRLAIWNRQKVIFVIVTAIWLIDIGFLVNGKYLLQVMEEYLVTCKSGDITGMIRVNLQFGLV